jgi:hypothetical protein
MGLISKRVTLHLAEKACQGQTFKLIWPISNLQREKKCCDNNLLFYFNIKNIFFWQLMLQRRRLECVSLPSVSAYLKCAYKAGSHLSGALPLCESALAMPSNFGFVTFSITTCRINDPHINNTLQNHATC